jgi:protein-S-isoprenylcysteine O-methyltransferase Ste14
MIWLVKSQVFPDKRWEQIDPLPWAIGMFATLALYWIAPLIIVSQNVQAPVWYMAGCIAVYTFGIFLHFASDMQKHAEMQLRPGRLITDGLWAWVRNPNYLGELLVYIGFGALAMHWAPFAVMMGVIAMIWVPNMIRKDRSLSRYPEFEEYRRRTKLILPFVL